MAASAVCIEGGVSSTDVWLLSSRHVALVLPLVVASLWLSQSREGRRVLMGYKVYESSSSHWIQCI